MFSISFNLLAKFRLPSEFGFFRAYRSGELVLIGHDKPPFFDGYFQVFGGLYHFLDHGKRLRP